MSWHPYTGRYENMQYRYCGKSGLRLPALSLGLWLIQAAGVRNLAILAGFLLLSEGLKIATLWYCRGEFQGIKR
mgnify:CR=1 FL=1